MDEMLLKKNEQIEGPPNKMDVAFQLEALVTSHSVETQEQPEVSTTALSSLAQECNVEDLGGEVSEDSDGDSSSSSSPFSSATVFENAADDDGLNQPAPFKTKDTFSFEMDARLLKKKEQIERSSKEIDIQLETLVTSHSVDTQEHPEANGYVHTAPPTTIPSLARECNIGGEDSDSDSSSSSSSFSSATVFENAADDDGLNQPAPFKTKDELLLEHTSTHAEGPEDPSEGMATPQLATPRLATPRPLPGSSDLLYDLQPHHNSSQASCHQQNSHDLSSPQYTSHDLSSPHYTSHDLSIPQHIGTQLTSPQLNKPHLTSPRSSSPWSNSSQSSNASSSSPQPSTSTGNTDHQLHPLQSPPRTTILKRKRRDDLLQDLEARRKAMERLLAIMDESHRFGAHVGDLVKRLHERKRGMAMREVTSYLYSLME
ncbi:uncharacterized protein LOC144020815 isoform X2 [Festucalex cinctus]